MSKKILTILIVIFTALLSGCSGKEPNEIAYVVALGLDKLDNNNYEMTIQYANTTAISGGGGEEGGKAGSEIVGQITVEAPNIYAGMGLANHIVSKTFTLSHAKVLVFSREVAQEGLKDMMETFARSEELRPDITIAIAHDKASEYLTSVTPEMEVNPVQYYQLIYQKNNLVGVPRGYARDFFFTIGTKDSDAVLPIAGVIEASDEGGEKSGGGQSEGGEQQTGGQDSGGQSGGGSSEGGGQNPQKQSKNEEQPQAPINEEKFEYKMRNYIGGQAAIEKKNKSEAVGSAIFKGDKMIGMMGSIETEMFKIMSGDYRDSYITLYSEETPESPITVKAIQDKKPKYKIDLDNKKIDIELFIESDLYSLPSDYNVENDIERFETNAQDYMNSSMTAFINEFIQKYDSDILGFKERSKYKFLTNEKYEEFKENVDFKEFDINVKTNFRIRRTGLMVKEEG